MDILLVEDDLLVAYAVGAVLTNAGHNVLGPAARSSDALELADGHHPALALVDIDLEYKHAGLDVARELANRDIPVLFVSGQRETAREACDAAVGFVSKPYDFRVMVDAIDFVERRNRDDEIVPPPGLEVYAK